MLGDKLPFRHALLQELQLAGREIHLGCHITNDVQKVGFLDAVQPCLDLWDSLGQAFADFRGVQDRLRIAVNKAQLCGQRAVFKPQQLFTLEECRRNTRQILDLIPRQKRKGARLHEGL